MEDELQQLIKELGDAINASLSGSDRFVGAMDEMEQRGYDVYVVLEASIGFRKKGEHAEMESRDAEIRITPVADAPDVVEITADDEKFLKALKISVE